MNTKLTITIEQTIIEKAKIYANKRGRSLSDIIENYLKKITEDELKDDIKLTPIVKSMKGSFKIQEGFDYKEELAKRLSEKYL
jgi:hypothetical protein